MKGLLPVFVVSVFVFTLILKVGFETGYIETGTDIVDPLSGKYTCQYSTLHCSCWSVSSGCELSCQSGVVKTLYHQAECMPQDELLLTGFYLDK